MNETFETIRYTADVVVIRGDQVLVIERGWSPHQGMLALPGGHVDAGETSLTAAVRELLEETGVHVDADALTLVGVYDGVGRDPRGRYVSVAYAVTVPADTIARAGDDAAAVRWVPMAEPGELAFDHARIVADAWRKQLDTAYARQVETETSGGRCAASHPSDPSPCDGPVAVTIVDRTGAGADGCEHHAARMLASLTGARVYALPDAPQGAATRTHTAAAKLPPYAWRRPLVR
ncbi:NUDIX domain-containing protein [Streptomyces sp. NPDC059999]|uniref:NUDIX domain-containing protein n=1 Tax=Streptomyces sp. NPDC059999 TaxID=3347030 RepID=UPI00369FAE30